jgi:hypothetical protein
MQNGFGLVIGMMAQQDPVCGVFFQGLVPYAPGGGLDTLAASLRNHDSGNGERDIYGTTDFAAANCPGVRIGAQAVVNVKR